MPHTVPRTAGSSVYIKSPVSQARKDLRGHEGREGRREGQEAVGQGKPEQGAGRQDVACQQVHNHHTHATWTWAMERG